MAGVVGDYRTASHIHDNVKEHCIWTVVCIRKNGMFARGSLFSHLSVFADEHLKEQLADYVVVLVPSD